MSTPSALHTTPAPKSPEYREYIPAGTFDDRSPCPALNTLANHGYIPRNGRGIRFFELIDALQHVYNITWFLAFFLTLVGFIISGKVTFVRHGSFIPSIRWTVALSTLSVRGPHKIAHDAAFVHPNHVPSHSPDKTLLGKFLSFTSPYHAERRLSGLSLVDIALYHKEREDELHSPLNFFHKQIAFGECGLTWAVMRKRTPAGLGRRIDECDEVVTTEVLEKWFGAEQLPDDWFDEDGSRPVCSIGLTEARRVAGDVAKWCAK